MSWAEEDWTVGLSGRVLQKVKELQVHHERLSRENKQKQLQLDNIHTSLEKQTVKFDEVRVELQSVQRELQSVRDEAKAAATSRDRLTQDFQTKQAQVCSLEGQLDAARTVNNKLTQEVKRLEAELEKLQNSSRSADTTLFSTPSWTTSPWEQNGSRKDERQRDEGQSRGFHSRQRLQFSDVRQQNRSTPHRHSSDQSEIFSTPSAAFPWERDDSRPECRRQSLSPSPQTPCAEVISQSQTGMGVCVKKDNRTETDTSLSEMKSRVSSLEEELVAKVGMLKSVQNEMAQSKKEIAAKELSLQKARDELSQAHTRITQEGERASGAEQRLKHVQEELKCQRQNAESSRLQHQQRTKELEKQHQRDLTELQKERQCLEKQHQQEVNKLNQELQQARTLHNALQAQADKLSLQKQALEKELEMLKEKLKWTEKQLQESQKKEAQTEAKLMETMREAEGVAVSLEQSRKRERVLEEEGKRLTEERADALRLLKELQEQIAAQAAAASLQPVQYFPAGQSFSPQPSYASHSRPSTHSKRPPASTRAEQRKEDDVDEKRTEITTSYPSDREPGEGIDSEHITVSTDVESSQRGGCRRKSNEAEDKSRNEMTESESAETKRQSASTDVTLSAEKTPEQAKASEELKRENAMLRSEVKDVREELQKRLEDLEAQRKAEAEARTRLKQLSRKHASKAAEKETQEREWKSQLENERAEMERLRKTLAALEMELKKRREDEGNQEMEKNKELEDRESEMTELNIQLKKQLAEVKAQLALEREERKREEEERSQITNTDIDEKNELNAQLAELKAELEELKHSRKDESLVEEHVSVTNSPLTYLTLRDDELNSNIVHCDNKLLPSPEQHHLFCQSTNQFNVLVSQATAGLFHEEQTMIDTENSPLSDKGKTGLTSDLDDTRQNYLEASPLSDQTETLDPLEQSETDVSDLVKEVERLKKEKAKATERANQSRVKLEALQSQVTRQTRQLTMAFEKQSQHISGLLVELQEKESTLLSQGEELQRCKEELETFKAEKEAQESEDVEESVKNTEEKLLVDDSPAQEDVNHPNTRTSDAVTLTSVSSEEDTEALLTEEQRPSSVISDQSESNHDSACVIEEIECGQDGDTADVVSKLLALQQENRLLKERIEGLTVTHSSSLIFKTDGENQEEPVERNQNTGNAVLFCLTEQRPPSELSDLTAEGQESLPHNERSRKEDGGDVKREDEGTTRDEEESQLQIKHLEQQVVALQMKVQTLSAETQQQAEELTMWRLASQEPPTFDQDNQDQSSSVGQSQSNQQQTDEITQNQTLVQVQGQTAGIQQRPNNVTIIREDNLLLSCFSNKLQSHILSSRLQHRDLPEPKSFHPSKKTAVLQEHNQDTAEINTESGIKNREINFLQSSDISPTEHKENRDAELFRRSSEETGQQHVTKDLHRVSKPNKTETTECHALNPEAKPDTSSATNEINTTNDSSGRAVGTEMKSVICQTEESLYPVTALAASELRCASTQTEEEKDVMDLAGSSSVSPVPDSERAESEDKLLLSGSFPIPTDPARLAERIRRNRTQLSAAFDDTEYEPYGLPEVVMKGFADIPTGPSCPYIVRRGLLGTTVVPAHQKTPGQEEETD